MRRNIHLPNGEFFPARNVHSVRVERAAFICKSSGIPAGSRWTVSALLVAAGGVYISSVGFRYKADALRLGQSVVNRVKAIDKREIECVVERRRKETR